LSPLRHALEFADRTETQAARNLMVAIGTGTPSQELMRWRPGLQFAVVLIIVGLL